MAILPTGTWTRNNNGGTGQPMNYATGQPPQPIQTAQAQLIGRTGQIPANRRRMRAPMSLEDMRTLPGFNAAFAAGRMRPASGMPQGNLQLMPGLAGLGMMRNANALVPAGYNPNALVQQRGILPVYR